MRPSQFFWFVPAGRAGPKTRQKRVMQCKSGNLPFEWPNQPFFDLGVSSRKQWFGAIVRNDATALACNPIEQPLANTYCAVHNELAPEEELHGPFHRFSRSAGLRRPPGLAVARRGQSGALHAAASMEAGGYPKAAGGLAPYQGHTPPHLVSADSGGTTLYTPAQRALTAPA